MRSRCTCTACARSWSRAASGFRPCAASATVSRPQRNSDAGAARIRHRMKLALFADIHSNLEAITACLVHARALGATRYAFLGDLVGYGADPVAVLDLVEEHAAHGAVVVLGNHDAAAIGQPVRGLNATAQRAIVWTQAQLGSRQRAFLD